MQSRAEAAAQTVRHQRTDLKLGYSSLEISLVFFSITLLFVQTKASFDVFSPLSRSLLNISQRLFLPPSKNVLFLVVLFIVPAIPDLYLQNRKMSRVSRDKGNVFISPSLVNQSRYVSLPQKKTSLPRRSTGQCCYKKPGHVIDNNCFC